MMRILQRILITTILFYLIIVFLSHRSVFTTPYNRQYWQERFDQSQWRLPLSQRIIGDDGLYLYAADQLIHGADPTSLNAETPLFGKYLIGFFLLLFKNGNLCGLTVNILILITFFFLTEFLLKEKTFSLVATALLAFDPLFTEQFFGTTINNTQLLLLLISFLLIAKINSNQSKRQLTFFSIFLGIVLGFFSATKLPIFTPLLFLLVILLYLKKKKLAHIFIFMVTLFSAYILTYLLYFTHGHSFFDWLGMQKWIVSFYQQSLLSPNKGSALGTLLLGQYQNLFDKTWQTTDLWSFSWPLITVLGTVGILKMILREKTLRAFLGLSILVFVFGVFILENLIPFWPRYLLLLLPFFYLGFTVFLANLRKTKLALIAAFAFAIFNLSISVGILFPTPQKDMEQFLYDWQHGFFRDMYEQILRPEQEGKNPEEFRRFGQDVFYDAEIESAKIEIINAQWSHWQSIQNVRIKITYFTRNLGSFIEEKDLTVVKEKDSWRINWQWNLLINGLDSQKHLETSILEAKRGAIIDSQGIKLAEDKPSEMIWITSDKIKPEEEEKMIQHLEDLFGEKIAAAAFHQRYVGLNQPHKPTSIGVPPEILDQKQKQKLKEFSGLELTPKLGRIYYPSSSDTIGTIGNTQYFECCSLLYSTTTYDGLTGTEKEKNEILKGYNGGSLVIKDSEGKIVRKIIEEEKKDGQDIHL